MLVQHSRDTRLMERLIGFLGCGKYYPRLNRDFGEIFVKGFSDIESKIIPFFDKYTLYGNKKKDF